MRPSLAQPQSALLRDLYKMQGKVPLRFELFPPHSADCAGIDAAGRLALPMTLAELLGHA